MKIHQRILLMVCILASPHVTADTKELLKPVNPDKAQKLREYNDIFLKEELYFASRHRIVQVDTNLLNSEGEFTITPFDNVQILVKTEAIIPHQGFRTTWNGEMRTPPWLEEQINQLTEEERGNQSVAEFISSFTGITFYIHSWDRDKKTGTVIRSNKKEMGSSRQINDVPDIADIRRQAFKSVSGRFATIYPRKQFVLWPLKYTPKYHVIYEIDDSKLYTGRTDPDEDIRKQKQHDRYLKSLPREKPGKAIKGEL